MEHQLHKAFLLVPTEVGIEGEGSSAEALLTKPTLLLLFTMIQVALQAVEY